MKRLIAYFVSGVRTGSFFYLAPLFTWSIISPDYLSQS